MCSLEELFCSVDDFWQNFEPQWHAQQLSHGGTVRRRARSLSMSEIITILIAFHQSAYRELQAILLEARLRLLAQSLPPSSELPAIYRMDSLDLAAVVCLSQNLFWSLYWN